MANKNVHYEIVKQALIADGWKITLDPYLVRLGASAGFRGFVDLAVQILGAEKNGDGIAVEIKDFVDLSDLQKFEADLGQYSDYESTLSKAGRKFFLAIPQTFYRSFFENAFAKEFLGRYELKIVIFDEINAKVIEWKH